MQLAQHNFALDSGERIATLAVDDIHPDHWERYHFAVQHLLPLGGPLVGADVFCGAGYGTHLLAQKLPCFILGIDGSADAIRQASEHYTSMNMLFSQKFFPFALPAAHFDFIVSMESLEHVEDGELFFFMLAKSLKPGGRLVISAPNSDVFDLQKNPYKWHFRHYTPTDMLELGSAAGLESITWAGASCNLSTPEGKIVSNNFYSMVESRLRVHHAGGTITHVFEKPMAL